MNFEEAREKHAQWRFTFRSAIVDRTTLDLAAIAQGDRCAVGRWLHGEARARYAGLPSYGGCLSTHDAFHVEASRVATLINAGRYDEAGELLGLGSAYSLASATFGQALNALEAEAG
ncbi:MAG: CZB domain-containing protein [Vicinamibacteria bacterium]